MGIPIVPPAKVPAPGGCGACFDPGETPVHIFAFLQGIGRGIDWFPALGSAPNGLWQLTRIRRCTWQGGLFPWVITYTTNLPGTTLSASFAPLLDGLLGTDNDNCEAWFVLIPDNFWAFYWTQGFGLVTMTADCPIISLSNLAESVGLHPGPNLFSEPVPKAANQAVILFADVPESTRVRILLDCP